MIRVCSRWFAAFSFLCAAISGARAAGVDFEGQIAPILITSCVPCHGGSKVMGGLRLTTRVGASKVIVPGSPEKSLLWLSIETPAEKTGAMPPGGPQLSKQERDLIRNWILAGAPWPNGAAVSTTASFKTLKRLKHPKCSRTRWPSPARRFPSKWSPSPPAILSWAPAITKTNRRRTRSASTPSGWGSSKSPGMSTACSCFRETKGSTPSAVPRDLMSRCPSEWASKAFLPLA
ncbi:MAG: hypothetical protein DMG59_15170 [Acidobacteria bacterium]|nr:MAG: hypothetical protein DMG59_15170 [Acidobacteriota bacterium]